MREDTPKEIVQSFLTKTIQKALYSTSRDEKKPIPGTTSSTTAMSSNQGRFAIKEELTNIRTFELITRTKSILEKIFWAIIAISGTIFIYHVVVLQLENWRDNPTLVTTVTKKLADMPLPAITFCHKGLQKYGLVEHLGNFIDPATKVPKEIVSIRNEVLKIQFKKMKEKMNTKDFCGWLFGLTTWYSETQDNPILSGIQKSELDVMKEKCDVSLCFSYITRLSSVFTTTNLKHFSAISKSVKLFQDFQLMIQVFSEQNHVPITQVKNNIYGNIENTNGWNLGDYFSDLISSLKAKDAVLTKTLSKGNEYLLNLIIKVTR